jgi:hypothetical protein
MEPLARGQRRGAGRFRPCTPTEWRQEIATREKALRKLGGFTCGFRFIGYRGCFDTKFPRGARHATEGGAHHAINQEIAQ